MEVGTCIYGFRSWRPLSGCKNGLNILVIHVDILYIHTCTDH